MICICDNCHYIFDSVTLPAACPNCGRGTINKPINRRFGPKSVPAVAVRVATVEEINKFRKREKK